jgi:hypothetical protein
VGVCGYEKKKKDLTGRFHPPLLENTLQKTYNNE